ncbi:hypothetical protein KZ483_26090 [Paenibacillus sp. sptzw28]|uniref:hypothetical protein n=1 Tax=Paenibacillus sp. sptzw28 TaxID=715179 RepID=UPI001C6E410B|nr:hypothetical protein [Paenibacillus sp. sptzw28]QYR21137.1 hypothetical protein KZ483_26090 [Paenibacillus sp. sptzw28]
MTNDIQRIQVRFNKQTFDRLQSLSDRYGIPVNSVVSFIVGQWLDQNDSNMQMREKINNQLLDSTAKQLSSGDQFAQLLGNPIFAQMMHQMLNEVADKAVKHTIQNDK